MYFWPMRGSPVDGGDPYNIPLLVAEHFFYCAIFGGRNVAFPKQISELWTLGQNRRRSDAHCDVLTHELEAARSHRLPKRDDLEFNHWKVDCGILQATMQVAQLGMKN